MIAPSASALSATCSPPETNTGRRITRSRAGDSPITDSSITTPTSAASRMRSVSRTSPNPSGPSTTPAAKYASTAPRPSFLNTGTAITAASRNTSASSSPLPCMETSAYDYARHVRGRHAKGMCATAAPAGVAAPDDGGGWDEDLVWVHPGHAGRAAGAGAGARSGPRPGGGEHGADRHHRHRGGWQGVGLRHRPRRGGSDRRARPAGQVRARVALRTANGGRAADGQARLHERARGGQAAGRGCFRVVDPQRQFPPASARPAWNQGQHAATALSARGNPRRSVGHRLYHRADRPGRPRAGCVRRTGGPARPRERVRAGALARTHGRRRAACRQAVVLPGTPRRARRRHLGRPRACRFRDRSRRGPVRPMAGLRPRSLAAPAVDRRAPGRRPRRAARFRYLPGGARPATADADGWTMKNAIRYLVVLALLVAVATATAGIRRMAPESVRKQVEVSMLLTGTIDIEPDGSVS